MYRRRRRRWKLARRRQTRSESAKIKRHPCSVVSLCRTCFCRPADLGHVHVYPCLSAQLRRDARRTIRAMDGIFWSLRTARTHARTQTRIPALVDMNIPISRHACTAPQAACQSSSGMARCRCRRAPPSPPRPFLSVQNHPSLAGHSSTVSAYRLTFLLPAALQPRLGSRVLSWRVDNATTDMIPSIDD